MNIIPARCRIPYLDIMTLTPLMCKTSITKLQRVQNQGMRLILGAPKWTCTTSMSQELTMLPVRVRSEIAVAKLVDKIKFMPSHPLHVSCARPAIIDKERSKWLIRCRDIHIGNLRQGQMIEQWKYFRTVHHGKPHLSSTM